MTTELKGTVSAAQDIPYFLVRVFATILDNLTPSMLLNNPLIPALPSHSQLKILFPDLLRRKQSAFQRFLPKHVPTSPLCSPRNTYALRESHTLYIPPHLTFSRACCNNSPHPLVIESFAIWSSHYQNATSSILKQQNLDSAMLPATIPFLCSHCSKTP